jgi:hypothetical protein
LAAEDRKIAANQQICPRRRAETEVARLELIAIALIVFGTSVLFDYVASVQVRALRMMTAETPGPSSRIAVSVGSSTNTATMMAGVALISLGILALSGVGGHVLV